MQNPWSFPPESQTWVTVTSQHRRLNVLQPHEQLYSSAQICLTNGVVQVEPSEQFKVLVANFAPHTYKLAKNQIIGTLLPHPTTVVDSQINFADVVGVAGTIGNATCFKAQSGEEATATTAPELESESINLNTLDLSHVPRRYRNLLRYMPRKYSGMWYGPLGEIHTTEYHIDVTPSARPIASALYRAGPKVRETEQAEVERMLLAGVIEPSKSAWASPVVLVPKCDGSLRFCVDYRRLNVITVRDS